MGLSSLWLSSSSSKVTFSLLSDVWQQEQMSHLVGVIAAAPVRWDQSIWQETKAVQTAEDTMPAIQQGGCCFILWDAFFSTKDRKTSQGLLEDTWKKTSEWLQKTRDWAGGSPSIWSTALNVQPEIQWIDLNHCTVMLQNGLVKV